MLAAITSYVSRIKRSVGFARICACALCCLMLISLFMKCYTGMVLIFVDQLCLHSFSRSALLFDKSFRCSSTVYVMTRESWNSFNLLIQNCITQFYSTFINCQTSCSMQGIKREVCRMLGYCINSKYGMFVILFYMCFILEHVQLVLSFLLMVYVCSIVSLTLLRLDLQLHATRVDYLNI